jgi:hypothetical protein
MQRDQFLAMVEGYIKIDPEAAAYVSDYVAHGLNASRKEALERAADMEVALSVMIAQRYKGREALVLDKLRKWNGKSSLRWDDTINAIAAR